MTNRVKYMDDIDLNTNPDFENKIFSEIKKYCEKNIANDHKLFCKYSKENGYNLFKNDLCDESVCRGSNGLHKILWNIEESIIKHNLSIKDYDSVKSFTCVSEAESLVMLTKKFNKLLTDHISTLNEDDKKIAINKLKIDDKIKNVFERY